MGPRDHSQVLALDWYCLAAGSNQSYLTSRLLAFTAKWNNEVSRLLGRQPRVYERICCNV